MFRIRAPPERWRISPSSQNYYTLSKVKRQHTRPGVLPSLFSPLQERKAYQHDTR